MRNLDHIELTQGINILIPQQWDMVRLGEIAEELKTGNNTNYDGIDLSGDFKFGDRKISEIMPEIRGLSVSFCIGVIATILEGNANLKRLNLSNIPLTAEDTTRLAEALGHNNTLQSLKLDGSNMTLPGIRYLEDALKNNYTLLSVSGITLDQSVIEECLERNIELNKCLQPLFSIVDPANKKDLDVINITKGVREEFHSLFTKEQIKENQYLHNISYLLHALVSAGKNPAIVKEKLENEKFTNPVLKNMADVILYAIKSNIELGNVSQKSTVNRSAFFVPEDSKSRVRDDNMPDADLDNTQSPG